MTRKIAVCGSITLLLLLTTTFAHADTIAVTTDRIIDSAAGAVLDLDGTTFIANGRGAADLSMLPAVLTPGAQVNLSHTFNTTFETPFEFGGTAAHALVNGTTYSSVILQASNFTFDATPFSLSAGLSSAPFTFTGTLNGFAANAPGTLLFSTNLVGQGMASLATHAAANGALGLDGVTYTFQQPTASPTPEPAPFVLLALGLIGVAGWRARHTLA